MAEVKLLAGLRDQLGGGARQLHIEASHVGELVERLIEASGRGNDARAAIFADGGSSVLARDIRILVNGRNVQFLSGLATPLSEADAVTLHFTGARGYPGG